MNEPEHADEFDDGWDMTATLVDGRWVDRSPRRPEIEAQARREAALLPWLAPRLPLDVPIPRIVSEVPLTLRHDLVVGTACAGDRAAHGRGIGRFLRALHAVDPDEAVRHGARDAEGSAAQSRASLDQMTTDVLPLLPAHLASAGSALLERLAVRPHEPRLIHGDLGPSHIRVDGDQVSGVIDWGDSGVGDPALDLAWTVHGSGAAFANAVAEVYQAGEALLSRAMDYHLLGPWHEVLFGLETTQDELVESGLQGAVSRLQHVGRHT